MALYDYKCDKCEHMFEVERPIGAGGSAKCPACGSLKTMKVFSAAGIVFKGGGFYVNDSKPKATESKPAPAGKPLEKPGESSDAKPASPETAAPAKTESASKPAGGGDKL